MTTAQGIHTSEAKEIRLMLSDGSIQLQGLSLSEVSPFHLPGQSFRDIDRQGPDLFN